MEMTRSKVEHLIELALQEDLGDRGDITTDAVVPKETKGSAKIVAKQRGILAGLQVAAWVFEHVDPDLQFEALRADGEEVLAGETIATLSGRLRAILVGERTALNFLGRLSGIATYTRAFARAVQGTKARILDTRKTTPGWRYLEKYAVRCGGGVNHRMGLWDQVLVKDNHVAAAGSLQEAVRRVIENLANRGIRATVVVEARSLEDVRDALALRVDRILLDNMHLEQLRQAVALVRGRVPLEASGNVTLENVRAVAETGVDFISVGAITHSAPAFDLSLQVEPSTDRRNNSRG